MLFFPNGTTLWRKKCSNKIPNEIPVQVFYYIRTWFRTLSMWVLPWNQKFQSQMETSFSVSSNQNIEDFLVGHILNITCNPAFPWLVPPVSAQLVSHYGKACHKSQWLVGSCWVQLSLEAEKYCLLNTSNSMYMYFFIDSTLSQVTIPLRVESHQSGH